jgi:hypothetical protein
MGAINKDTNNYEYPRMANKKNKYKCPSCDKDIIFRKGKQKKPHFAHKQSLNPCNYYNKPTESQIHKDAKMLMKSLLDNKTPIIINKKCELCDIFLSTNIDYHINGKTDIEYKFIHNESKKSADVAFIENNNIKYIFEICYKHKTKEENRPEPWFEICAETFINLVNCHVNNTINIQCIRDFTCNSCIEKSEKIRLQKIKEWQIKKEQEIKEEEREQKREEEREQKREEEREQKREEERQTREQERQTREQEKEEEEKKCKQKAEYEKKQIEKTLKNLENEFTEYEKKVKEEEIKKKEICKNLCNIKEICLCDNPKYELVKLSKNLFCKNCSKWKCRC